MRKLPLIAAALAGFLIALAVFLPAQLAARWLPSSVTVGTLTGSLWNGSTDYLAVEGRPLGAFRWEVHPSQLFLGRLVFDAELSAADANARGRVTAGTGGRVSIEDLELHWPLATLPFSGVPPRWNGELQANLRKLAIENSNIHEALGTVDVRNLQSLPPDSSAIGSYRLSFDAGSKQNGKLIGRLQDLEGPMQVSGTLALGPNRDYLLEGLVAPRAGAAEAIVKSLRFLGAPDAQGRRPFSSDGTY